MSFSPFYFRQKNLRGISTYYYPYAIEYGFVFAEVYIFKGHSWVWHPLPPAPPKSAYKLLLEKSTVLSKAYAYHALNLL